MWDDFLYSEEGIEIAKEIEKLLMEKGFKFEKPKFFRNRNNMGGRIYIKVIGREGSSRGTRRHRGQYAEY
jgi:hypothetical protein